MENVVLIIHLLLALALIGVVLLQRSEGGGLGMGGGGGAMTGRAAATALGKVTWLLAAAFFACCRVQNRDIRKNRPLAMNGRHARADVGNIGLGSRRMQDDVTQKIVRAGSFPLVDYLARRQIDRLDDRLQRFRHQFDRIIRIEAVGFHMNIDHRHGDLRFFFTWQGNKSNQPEGKGSHQEQRGER